MEFIFVSATVLRGMLS